LHTAEFTLDAKPGLVLWDSTLLFALLGVAFNQPKLDFSESVTFTFDGTPSTVAADFRERGRWAHFRWGLGFEQMLICRLSLNVTYTYTYYGRLHFSKTLSNTVGTVTTTEATSDQVKFRRQVISAGLSWYF